MPSSIDAVAGSAPGHLLPVESINTHRRAAPQEQHALAPDPVPGASFTSRSPAGPNAYAPSGDAVHGASNFVRPDPVAPALAEALAAEPWGHPMPEKSAWEQAAAVRERLAAKVLPEAPVTVAAATPKPAAPAADAATTPVTPVATTAAAPATHAAAVTAGPAAPVSPAWLGSLLKSR
jgi:hypothetical protein